MEINFLNNAAQLIENIKTAESEIEQLDMEIQIAKESVMNAEKEEIEKVNRKFKEDVAKIKERAKAKLARDTKRDAEKLVSNQKLLAKYLEEKEILAGKLAIKQAKNEISEEESELLKQLLI